ncbi:MAG: tetratricopeptide repeat protein [Bacteroidota bacterium]
MNIYYCRKKCLVLTMLLYAGCCINAQETDWNKFKNAKERVDTMRKYSINLLKLQRLDEAVIVISKALSFSTKASLDSATGANLYLLASAYRYKAMYDSAFYFLGKAKEIGIQNKLVNLQTTIEIEAYGLYNRMGKPDSADAVIGRLKEMLPNLDSNSRESGKIEMYIGHSEKHKAKYTSALDHYFKALHKFIYLKDSANEGNIYVSLANVLVITGQLDNALNYHRQAAALFTRLNRRVELLNELENIIDLYYTSGRLDSAEASVKRALVIAEQFNDKSSQTYIYLHLGNIYKRRKKFPESETYLLKALAMSGSVNDETLTLEINQGLGEMYMSEKQFAKATPYLEKHLALAKQTNNREEITEASWNLSDNEYALHHYAKAYEYKNLYSIYRDSAFQESSAKSIAEMEAKYQAEKKEKEIALLKKDQQLDKLSLQKQANFRAGAVIFLLLLLLIAFLLVNRYRIAQQTKRLIEMEKMRNGLARDLHDDIGSTITSINIMSRMSLQQPAGQDSMIFSSMHKIQDRSAAIMESLGDIVWAINPQNDTVEQMICRMKEFTEEILGPQGIQYTFNEEGNPASLALDIKKRKDFYLLFKEAVNNAAKYSQCKNLFIQLRQEAQSLFLSVKDDGIGFDETAVTNGNGLRNMRERAAAMGAKISINTAPGKGTGIFAEVPTT